MARRDIALKHFDENRDFMQYTVQSGIERHRKGNATLTVTDREGNPISNAVIRAKQKNHEFRFGANIFMLGEFENETKNERYKERFSGLFNLATLPFYWNSLEPEQGKLRYAADSPRIYRRPAIDPCIDFCLTHGIEPKLHCLNYDNFTPDWMRDVDVNTHKRLLEKRIRELAERYASVIPSWEVTNETFKTLGNYYQTKFYKEPDFVEWSFCTADKYLPNNRLIINDYFVFDPKQYRENRSPYFMQIERLLYKGITHLDSIGMQFHSFFPKEKEEWVAKYRYDPVYLYEVMDLYATLGTKLQITEMTIPAFSDGEEDEAVQAELLRNLYTVFFSHPAMEAAIYWNLVDGYAWKAEPGDMSVGENQYWGGLLRFDLSEKPAYRALQELFTKEWHTETECATAENGTAGFRGFFGTYDLEITADGKTVIKEISLRSDKNNVNTLVIE